MAYILKIHDAICSGWSPDLLCMLVRARTEQHGFKCDPKVSTRILFKGPREGSRKPSAYVIDVGKVRLAKKKPYCGNHPGPCIVGPFGGVAKKMKATYLEWDDWVKFHGIVNDILDFFMLDADVTSNPQDARGTFFMRKGTKRRYIYDYEEDWSRGRRLLLWNLGTEDQFVKPAAEEVEIEFSDGTNTVRWKEAAE